ncbi:hypothetical protein GQ54DRAFT_113059 [Martensiomyces pterosporus]|nr:hypothetical protein GQ54DRAFT_113059 [Martensiomyces pterosporus]
MTASIFVRVGTIGRCCGTSITDLWFQEQKAHSEQQRAEHSSKDRSRRVGAATGICNSLHMKATKAAVLAVGLANMARRKGAASANLITGSYMQYKGLCNRERGVATYFAIRAFLGRSSPAEDAELDLGETQKRCLTSSSTYLHDSKCLCIRSPRAGRRSFLYMGRPLLMHAMHQTKRWLWFAISPVSWKCEEMPRRGRPGLRAGGSVSSTTLMGFSGEASMSSSLWDGMVRMHFGWTSTVISTLGYPLRKRSGAEEEERAGAVVPMGSCGEI